ncbi:MAG: xanthine dehydrogenase family protein molybdopterin-binding subunit [Aigarchaeota archaeon]|nr:xanthine dehydrogenase family protein molybdopterin-binding subunit [Aigarchaeota archaeon]MDW8092814.1 xanthine dehydrogenase family protein molybdopterin-binding subunit [Nitrososphaerota archaeon]
MREVSVDRRSHGGGEIESWYLRERVARLIKGLGKFVDDLQFDEMYHCALVTSNVPHAFIRSIDPSRAYRLPGVKRVLTGKELPGMMNPLPMLADYSEMGLVWRRPIVYPLAVDKIRFAGEPVAAVVAKDRYTAHDAAELVEVDYERLPPVSSVEAALDENAPLLYPEWGENVQCRFEFKTPNFAEVFGTADRVIRMEWREARQSGFPIETRGCVAVYDKSSRRYQVFSSTQSPAMGRRVIAEALGVRTSDVTVYACDVGGGFGNKLNFSLETLACVLAKTCDRPVKLIETRYQSFIMGPHQRDVLWRVEAGVTNSGLLLAIKGRLYVDLGVEGTVRGCGAPSIIPASLSAVGAYRVKAVDIMASGVVTNKSFYDAYRGYGKDKGAKMIERLMNRIAIELGMTPEEVRFRNLIGKEELPYRQINGYVYDSGDYRSCLERALRLLDVEGWRRTREQLRLQGRYIGIGISLCLEPAGGAIPYSIYSGYEGARVRVSEDGVVEVYTNWIDIGQGSLYTIGKVVSDIIGVNISDVKVHTGSSDYIGLGPYSSRGASYSVSAIAKASKAVRERVLKIASHLLECRVEDLDVADSKVFVREDPTRAITLKELCKAVYFKGQQKTLSTELMNEALVPIDVTVSWFSPLTSKSLTTYTTVAYSADTCVVEVDTATGTVKILRYVSVHDSGKIIDHNVVEGQVIGGLAQAIGGALYEEVSYDELSNPLTTSFVDYLIPSAKELEFPIDLEYIETPSPYTELGAKGTGELPAYSGTVTVVNAIEDALGPFNVSVDSIPVKPQSVLRFLEHNIAL